MAAHRHDLAAVLDEDVSVQDAGKADDGDMQDTEDALAGWLCRNALPPAHSSSSPKRGGCAALLRSGGRFAAAAAACAQRGHRLTPKLPKTHLCFMMVTMIHPAAAAPGRAAMVQLWQLRRSQSSG